MPHCTYRAAQMQRIVLLALCRCGAARIWILWMDGGGGGAATEQTTYAHDGSQKSGALTTWLVLFPYHFSEFSMLFHNLSVNIVPL